MGISVHKLNTDLLGEGQLNLLASWLIQLSDALLIGEVLTADTGQEDWLVDAGLDWLGVGNRDWDSDGGDNWDVVLGLLGDLVAVVVSVSTMSVSTVSIAVSSWLADSDHLGVGLLLEGDLNSLGGGVLLLLLVAVGADLIGDLLNGLSADSPGHVIAELNIDDLLDGQLNIGTGGLEGWGADISDLGDIPDGAVVLGLLIAVVGLVVSWGSVVVGWGSVVSWGWVVGSWGVVGVVDTTAPM